ncbi:hypothetical protein ARMGADRAFT_813650 [Armillaria gallica]|uniref:Uncharacterized protein n=1 Tax=Armillaria gallica TaxID=47427 RepID=A0A2H3CDT0_ARMGA|nr:hypothetical protein ARMGADRAFT_813650 [Armillaria gallica]
MNHEQTSCTVGTIRSATIRMGKETVPKELRSHSRRMHWSHCAYSDGLVDRCSNSAKEDERQTKKMAGKRGGLVHVALQPSIVLVGPSRTLSSFEDAYAYGSSLLSSTILWLVHPRVGDPRFERRFSGKRGWAGKKEDAVLAEDLPVGRRLASLMSLPSGLRIFV